MTKNFKRKRNFNNRNKNPENKTENDNNEKQNEESRHEKIRSEITKNNFDQKNTPYQRQYSHHLKSLMNEDEMNEMFIKSIDRLPTCFRFRKQIIDFSHAHKSIKENLILNLQNINNEINEIKKGARNDVFNFSSEEIERLAVSNPKFQNNQNMNAIVMPEISRKDLRKAKRGTYKESKDMNQVSKDNPEPIDNEKFPIFNLLTKVQKSLTLLNDQGIISRQELVSMLPPLILNIQKGDFVLDMCAAPGSKTKQISEMAGCTGLVVANELEFSRTYTLTNNMKAGLGESLLGNTMVINHPAQFLPDLRFNIDIDIDVDNVNVNDNSPPHSFAELLKQSHHRTAELKLKQNKILCDVPCTGDGAIRKCPNRWWEFKAKDGYGISALQYCILERGFNLLVPEGQIAYSTCSINVIENECVVARFLKENPDSELVDVQSVKEQSDMLTELDVKYSCGLKTWDALKSCKHKQNGEEDGHHEGQKDGYLESKISDGDQQINSGNLIDKPNSLKDLSPNKLNNIESENIITDPVITEKLKSDRYHRNKDGSWSSPYQNDSAQMVVDHEIQTKVTTGEIDNFQNLKETQQLKDYHFEAHQSNSILDQLPRCLRIQTHHNDSGGFFIALIRKKSQSSKIKEQTQPKLTNKDNNNQSYQVMPLQSNISTHRMKECTFFLNEPQLRPLYDTLSEQYQFKRDISHNLLMHSTKSKHIQIVNDTLSHMLRHNGTITESKYESDKEAKINHRQQNVAQFGTVLFKKDKLDSNPMDYRMAQDGIHFVQDVLGKSRTQTLNSVHLLKQLLFFDLTTELKTQEKLKENEDKIKPSEKEGDITFDENAWNDILSEVNKSSPFSKFKDIQNGSLILVQNDEYQACFKQDYRLEIRTGKEMKQILKCQYNMIM